MSRPLLVAIVSVALLSGCDESTHPSPLAATYALGRIGLVHPPIPMGPDGGAPFLIADTLRLSGGRPREDLAEVLTRITVMQEADGTRHYSETRHSYAVHGQILSYDSCPLGSLCAASLVYAPLDFHIVGDSLFQIVPTGSPLPGGAVYGRVRR